MISRSTYLAINQMTVPAPSSPTTQQNQQGVEIINQNVVDLTNLVRKTHPRFLLIIITKDRCSPFMFASVDITFFNDYSLIS